MGGKRLMKVNNTLFVLDTETGGVDPLKSSLMEIAGIVLNGKLFIDTPHLLNLQMANILQRIC